MNINNLNIRENRDLALEIINSVQQYKEEELEGTIVINPKSPINDGN